MRLTGHEGAKKERGMPVYPVPSLFFSAFKFSTPVLRERLQRRAGCGAPPQWYDTLNVVFIHLFNRFMLLLFFECAL